MHQCKTGRTERTEREREREREVAAKHAPGTQRGAACWGQWISRVSCWLVRAAAHPLMG